MECNSRPEKRYSTTVNVALRRDTFTMKYLSQELCLNWYGECYRQKPLIRLLKRRAELEVSCYTTYSFVYLSLRRFGAVVEFLSATDAAVIRVLRFPGLSGIPETHFNLQ